MMYHVVMMKSEAVSRAGSAYRLALILGIKKQAVSKWGRQSDGLYIDVPLPSKRTDQLKKLRPEWFTTSERRA